MTEQEDLLHSRVDILQIWMWVTIILAVFSFGFCLLGYTAYVALRNKVDNYTELFCTEDMDCWDCDTMGNQTCDTNRNPQ